MVLKGDLTTVSTKEMVVLSVRLEGEKEGAPVQFPPDRRPAKPLADACCCASMQRSATRCTGDSGGVIFISICQVRVGQLE